jgi:MFS transporter, AAHS family, 3-hydroxyphenylpropionic acid transporter
MVTSLSTEASRRVNRAAESPAYAATIVGCVLVALCEGFDLQAAGVAASGIALEFSATANELGTFFSASGLGLVAGALLGGRLSDSFGRKRVLVGSICLFGLFSILTVAAWSMPSLSWARFLTGAGLGGALPNLLALVNESSAPRRRSANVALIFSGMPFGGALVSFVSLLTLSAHWRLIFIVGGAAPLLLAPILLWALPESPAFWRQAHSLGRAQTTPAPVLASTLEAGSFRAIFAHRRALPTLLLWLTFFLQLLTIYLLLSWLPTLLMGNGLSGAEAAGAQIAFNIGGALSALLIGQLLEGRARKVSIIVTFAAVPLFVLLLSSSPPVLGLVLLTVFALGCGLIAGQGFLYATAPRCYPALIRGVGVGSAVAVGRLGSIVGPKLGGMLKAEGHSSSQLLLDILPLVVGCSILALAFAWTASRLPDYGTQGEG